VMKNEKPTPAAPPAAAGRAAPGGGAGNGAEALCAGRVALSAGAYASATPQPPADARSALARRAGAS
jgi:hypothetical protein